jgi:uncharacterized protein (TIGR00290 family)
LGGRRVRAPKAEPPEPVSAPKAVMFWSGGKDSSLALDRVRRGGDFDVTALITTVNSESGRVSMHGVREALVARQAEAAGLPLVRMEVPSASTNATYMAALQPVLEAQRRAGVEAVIFGDIFLEDLRAWREGFLAEAGLKGVFPLWGGDTRALAAEFVERGFGGVVCCVDDARLDEQSLGRALDVAFFAGLPAGVDPCGENGEYHSFVAAGPIFRCPVRWRAGERVYRPLARPPAVDPDPHDPHPRIGVPAAPPGSTTRGFWFLDLLLEA